MREVIANQRAERDGLLGRCYQERRTGYSKEQLLASPLIKFISGPRRVGKSTYALLLLRGQNFAYLNFDDKQLLDRWDEDVVTRMLDDIYPNYTHLLLDEVQNLPGWDLWVSKLYRRGKNLVVTGSNANMLSSEMATVLTGRYLPVNMLPFSLLEVAEWHGVDVQNASPADQSAALLADYLRNGGYPETIAAREIAPNYLATLFDSILLKDIAKRHNVRKTVELYNIASYLLSNFCNPLSFNGIAAAVNVPSVSTVQRFCGYLTEPFIFFFLPRFSNKLKVMKKADQKVYIIDNGFVGAAAFGLGKNLGRLLENQVFVELVRQGYKPGQTLFYYHSRTGKEVDFVTCQGGRVERLIQVCYDLSAEKTRRREFDAIVECANELGCSNLTVVSYDADGHEKHDNHTIQIVPVARF